MSLARSVERGPRIVAARDAEIDAKIRHAEARAKKAHDQAAAYRRRAKGTGPLAKYRKLQADGMDIVADRHRAEANQLRADLAKAKADQAAKEAKRVKRTVASTAATGLTPKTPGHPGQARTGRGGQVAKPTGQQQANGPERVPASPKAPPETHGPLCPCCGGHHGPDYRPKRGKHCGWCNGHRKGGGPNYVPDKPSTKGPTMTAISGEAVNIEQTRANLDQLKGQVSDLRGSFEGISGSLASGGLNQLAGSLASADDSLDSVLTQITAAEKHLSDQEAIAEAAQAAGEMHTDTSFYG